MKIVIACKYVKRSFGGAEKVIFDLSNILLDLGHEVTICHHEQTNKEVTYEINKNVKFKNSFGLGKNLFTSKFNKNIENFCFDNLPNDINEGEVFYYLKLNKSFREELASSILTENPDLVIAFLPHTFTHILIQLSKIVPIFVPLQNSPKEDFFNLNRHEKNKIDRILRFKMLEHSSAVSVLIDNFQNYFKELKLKRIFTTPNIIETPIKFRKEYKGEHLKNFVSVGRLEPQKGFETLVNYLSFSLIKNYDLKCDIYGTGSSYLKILNELNENLMHDTVNLLGFETKILEKLINYDIFIIPSLYEGWGLTLTEAMSVGLICIGFDDCEGVNSIINEKNGILIKRDVNSFFYALDKINKDKKKQNEIRENSIYFCKQFSKEKVKNNWDMILKKMS